MINLKNNKFVIASALLLMVTFTTSLKAQLVGTGAFIKATSLEIGISGAGGMEGTTAAPPVGMHPRGGFGIFGFVANPQVNAWATFFGDYFAPGSPENGWGLQVGNSATSPNFSNNSSGPLLQISSAPTLTYTQVLNCFNVDWTGSVISGTTNIKAHINYFAQLNDLYYTTTVTLINNSASVIPELYYYRNVDPDNNQPVTGSYTTNQLIEDQPTVGLCNLACVSASQTGSAGVGTSYLAFAAVGPDFRVCYGGFSNRLGYNIWNGVGFTQTVGATNTADEAISLGYKITAFLPGTSRTFKFVTILNGADKVAAINNLLSLSFPGSAYVAPSACSPLNPPDTARICGPTKIEITGSNVTSYNWSWLPTTALSTSTTFSAIVNPTVTTTYTITGIPTSPCASTVPATYTVVVIPSPPLPVTINPAITVCTGAPVYLTVPSGGVGATYAWSGPGGYASAVQNPTIAVSSLTMSGTYTAMVTVASGCTSTALTNLTVTPAPTITLTSTTNTVCVGQSATLSASGSSTFSWSPSSSLSFTAGPTNTASPTITTTYTVIVGAGSCTNAAVATVSVIPTPILVVSSATICAGKTATLIVSGATSYTWSSGSTTNTATYSPATTTVFTVSGAASGVCVSVKSTTVTVIDYPVVNTSTTTNLNCNGISTGSIVLNVTGATGYNWTPNVSTSSTAAGLAAGIYTCVLTVAPSCSVVTTYTVTEPTALIGATSYTNTSCGNCNGNASIIATGGTGAYAYNWMPSALTQTNVTGLCPKNYTVSVTDANNCVSSYTLTILPSPVFQATATASNLELYQGESITLAGHTGTSYTWTPVTALNCYTCATTIAKPMEDTRYCVDVKTNNGCRDTACVDIVILCGDIFVPSAYSPNGDGHNDELAIFGNCIIEIEFRIFDRWGELVFETKDVNGKWDGKYKGYAVTAGVFVYQLKAKLKNGESVSKTGNITVVR